MGPSTPGPAPLPIATALRRSLRAGYRLRDLRADLLAGLVVGTVALPLSMALAIAAGVPPAHGLATAILGGAVIALLGGSRFQVSGPTAAFVAVLAPITAEHGVRGLTIATAMAGVILIVFGIARLGRFVQMVPYPVTIGFTAGIGTVIGLMQLPDLLGIDAPGSGLWAKLRAVTGNLGATQWSAVVVGTITLGTLSLWRRLHSAVPGPLVALVVATAAAALLAALGHPVDTIASRFGSPDFPHGIPAELPHFAPPWTLPGADGRSNGISLELLKELFPAAVSIAVLGAIESLLSAVIADAQTNDHHDPDAELVAQGAGNLLVPFFGGIAATGALARTATNFRSGARSPFAAVFHAGVVLAGTLALAPLLGKLPMPALGGLLLHVAWSMAELNHVARVAREAPRSDSVVLFTCLVLTVVFDMTIAVTVGIVLAAFLFMRRMIELGETRAIEPSAGTETERQPHGIAVYEIAGPLFFGAAHKATSVLHRVGADVRVVVLDLSAVPVIDATGLFNLRSAIARLRRQGARVLLTGLAGRPKRALRRAGLLSTDVESLPSLDAGLARARELLGAAS